MASIFLTLKTIQNTNIFFFQIPMLEKEPYLIHFFEIITSELSTNYNGLISIKKSFLFSFFNSAFDRRENLIS